MTKIYHYDPVTGRYLTQSEADINPLDPDQLLIPAYATDKAPPKINENEIVVFVDGKWTKQSKPAEPEPTAGQLKAAKLAQINASYETLAQLVVVGVPPSEVQSWSKQEAEARALQENPDAEAITLRALAEARSIPLDILCKKVIEKADAYSAHIGSITGIRQRLEDQLNVIDLSADNAPKLIEGIKWPE